MIRPPPRPPLFPYPPLSRSLPGPPRAARRRSAAGPGGLPGTTRRAELSPSRGHARDAPGAECLEILQDRSEEHTSELQSLAYLVCRLLLEKKKRKKTK